MMYSAAMPILYFFGSLICLIQYWSDKILFLRHYRLPPRYGRVIASRTTQIMEFSILLHLIVGLFMLTSLDIFSTEDTNKHENLLLVWLTKKFTFPIVELFGLEKERFMTNHAVLYICGIALFLVCFLLERFFSLFRTAISNCLCLSDDNIQSDKRNFCSNIYEELSIEA